MSYWCELYLTIGAYVKQSIPENWWLELHRRAAMNNCSMNWEVNEILGSALKGTTSQPRLAKEKAANRS